MVRRAHPTCRGGVSPPFFATEETSPRCDLCGFLKWAYQNGAQGAPYIFLNVGRALPANKKIDRFMVRRAHPTFLFSFNRKPKTENSHVGRALPANKEDRLFAARHEGKSTICRRATGGFWCAVRTLHGTQSPPYIFIFFYPKTENRKPKTENRKRKTENRITGSKPATG
jgi:hypothetical protein